MIARAVAAWKRGRPHEAWQILDKAGYADYWPIFHREALRAARRAFLARLP